MTASATNPTRHSSGSMPLYSASPPQTPPRTLSVALRRRPSAGGRRRRRRWPRRRVGRRGPGAGERTAGAVRGHGRKRAAAAAAAHRGRPPFFPGPPTRATTVPHRGGRVRRWTMTPAPGTRGAPRPPLARPRAGRLLAGVAVGVAAHRGLDRSSCGPRSSSWRHRFGVVAYVAALADHAGRVPTGTGADAGRPAGRRPVGRRCAAGVAQPPPGGRLGLLGSARSRLLAGCRMFGGSDACCPWRWSRSAWP